jgi:hypothetical protein
MFAGVPTFPSPRSHRHRAARYPLALIVTREVEELWLRRFLAEHGDDPDLHELVALQRKAKARRRLAWISIVLAVAWVVIQLI